jgi:hypothetical protein
MSVKIILLWDATLYSLMTPSSGQKRKEERKVAV